MDIDQAKEILKQHGYHAVNEEFMQRCFQTSEQNAQLRAENSKLREELNVLRKEQTIAPRDQPPLAGTATPDIAGVLDIDRCESVSPSCALLRDAAHHSAARP